MSVFFHNFINSVFWPISVTALFIMNSTPGSPSGTANGGYAFSVVLPTIWNKLLNVLAANSLPVLCTRLKTHLFTGAFADQ